MKFSGSIGAAAPDGRWMLSPWFWLGRGRALRAGTYIGIAIVGGLLFLSTAAPLLPFYDPLAVDYGARLSPPSLDHPFGTDNLGRDMLSRVIYGARIDLQLGFVTVAISMVIGMILGLLAGYYRGVVEAVVMRTVDAFLAFPFIVLVLAVVSIVGPGLTGVYIGILIVSWTVYARITYTETVSLRERQFILAARTLGFSDMRVITRHALPNVVRANVSFAMSDVVLNILGLASLSYLGVGVQPPAPEWGSLIAQGNDFLLTAWWISTLPGVVIVISGVGFSLLGEALSESLRVDAGRAHG